MGSNPSVISEELVFNSPHIHAENKDHRRVIVEHKPPDAHEISCFTKQAFTVSKQRLFTINISGAGVLRIGVTETDPATYDEFYKDPLFEKEDGFEFGESERLLFFDETIDTFCYGPSEDYMEFSPNRVFEETTTPLYLYVMFLYGKPTISVVYANTNVEWNLLTGSLINIGSDNCVTMSSVNNVSMVRIRDSMILNSCYHINWDMLLSREKIGEKSPKFGYLRIGFVSGDKEKSQMQLYSINATDKSKQDMAWFTESAVAQYPYSGTIGLTVSPSNISHNLMINSVGNTKEERKTIAHPAYLFIEASSGNLTVNKSPYYTVKQYAGSAFLVKDYDEFEDNQSAKFKINRVVEHEPYYIQYGPNPRAFVVMFNKRFTTADSTLFKKEFRKSVELPDTDRVQVLHNTGIIKEYMILETFSRPQQSGGGEIEEIKHSPDLPRCWIITYTSVQDARRVWMRKEITIEGVPMYVFPWYDDLGEAVNFGQKPVFDDSNLIITDLDQDKLMFVMESEEERSRVDKSLNSKIPVSIQWPQSDGFEGSDEEMVHLIIKCHHNKCNHIQRANWKDTVSRIVALYFSDTIVLLKITVDGKHFDKILEQLRKTSQNTSQAFRFMANRNNLGIVLISSDNNLLKTVAEDIRVIQNVNFKTSVMITKENLDRYHALDAEGILKEVRRAYPNTMYTVTLDGVKLTGPASEVTHAKAMIMERAIHTTEIQIGITPEHKKVLESQVGKTSLAEKLQAVNLCNHFKVEGQFCKLWIFQENEDAISRKNAILETIIRSISFEKFIKLSRKMMQNLERISIESLLQQFNLDGHDGSVHIEVNREKHELKISGTEKEVQEAETKLEGYLQQAPVFKSKVLLPIDAIDYISSWSDIFKSKPYSIETQDGMPVNITITATDSDTDKLKDALLKEAGRIKSHWFHITRPWLAVQRQELTDITDYLTESLQCNIDVETASLLASENISCIAIADNTGTICLSICCDILRSKVDVIIVPISSTKLHLSSGFAAAIAETGGKSVTDECNKHVHDYGEMKPFETVMLESGNLPCQQIVFAYVPPTDCTSDISMMNAMETCLNASISKCFVSVMIPVLQFCQKDNTDKSLDLMMKTIDAFVSKKSNGSLKEIGFCDMRLDVVDKIQKSVSANLQKSWFVLSHGKQIKEIEGQDQQVAIPLSSGGRRIAGRSNDSLRWGQTYYNPVNPTTQSDDSDDESSPSIKRAGMSAFQNGIPYRIELTDNLTLHIVKGQIQEMQSEVIVNPTPQFPNICGAVSNCLVKSGGDDILAACQRLDIIAPGDVKTTPAGKLKCKKLYHILQPMGWDTHTGFDAVHMIVKQCLQTASAEGVTSITFPTIGTGASHFPVDKVADAMVKAVFDLIDGSNGTTLKDITIVVFYRDTDTLKIFEEIIPELIANNNADDVINRHPKEKDTRDVIPKRRNKLMLLPSQKPGNHDESDDILLVKLTIKDDVKQAIEAFQKMVQKRFVKMPVKYEFEKLSNSEVRQIKNIETVHAVRVVIDEKKMTITLEGLKNNVDTAGFHLRQLLQLDFPNNKAMEKMRNKVMAYVQWFFDDNGQLKPYDDVSNFDIHFAYLEQKDFIYHNNEEDRKYQVLIQTLEEHPVSDSTKKRRMLQKQKVSGDITLPDTWTILGNDTAEVILQQTSQEYDDVKKKFLADGCKPTAILNIKRLEDKYKYLQYISKKKQLDNQNPNGTKNERMLWHGTDADTSGKIIKHGFDRSFAGKNATAYGFGVYFATTSSYSNRYAVPDAKGVCRMFLNKVLVGEYCRGDGTMFVLPEKCTVNNVKICYDSAVDNTGTPSMFVIFHDTQAYPEYLIEYNR